jgi:DNA-binding FrmR family transcriptional regulator
LRKDGGASALGGLAESKRRSLTRLRITAGHLEAIARMIEEDRPCAEILKQMAAVQSSLSRLANLLIKDHLEECIREIIAEGRRMEGMEELVEALILFKSAKFSHR